MLQKVLFPIRNLIDLFTGESQGTSNNYNLSNLPFGDLNYLTMPDGEESSDMPNMIMMEPLVQIDTTGEASRFCNQQPTIETTST